MKRKTKAEQIADLQRDNTAKHNLLVERQIKIDTRDQHIELLEKKLVSYDDEAAKNYLRINQLERELAVQTATVELLVNAIRSNGMRLQLVDTRNQCAATRPRGAGPFPDSPRTLEKKGAPYMEATRTGDRCWDVLYGAKVTQ